MSNRHGVRNSLRLVMIAKWVKDALGYARMSQAELARRMNLEFHLSVDRSAINKVTLGKRDLSAFEMVAISSITRFPVQDFDEISESEVEIIGKVAAGSDQIVFADSQGELGRTRAPEGSRPETVAVEVQGTSLGELLDGSRIFYDDVRNPPDNSMVSRLCVCGLSDGRVMVKSLRHGRLPGRWDLYANVGPPIYDAEVDWAAVVRLIQPPMAN